MFRKINSIVVAFKLNVIWWAAELRTWAFILVFPVLIVIDVLYLVYDVIAIPFLIASWLKSGKTIKDWWNAEKLFAKDVYDTII